MATTKVWNDGANVGGVDDFVKLETGVIEFRPLQPVQQPAVEPVHEGYLRKALRRPTEWDWQTLSRCLLYFNSVVGTDDIEVFWNGRLGLRVALVDVTLLRRANP